MLADYLCLYSTVSIETEWAMPTFTSVVAAMYWSRMRWLNEWAEPKPAFTVVTQDYDETHYNVTDSTISIKPTLNATWPLYLVLGVYPILTSLLILVMVFLKSAPVSTDFGMVSILSGCRKPVWTFSGVRVFRES
jgi:hypothetical protein